MPVRPDFSKYLAHFTKDTHDCSYEPDNPASSVKHLSPFEKLINILQSKRIMATAMNWTGCHAVCFTECPWSSIIDHTEHYSPYGVGFEKSFVFSRNGGPVYYVRADHFKEQEAAGGWASHVKPFVTPFWPSYRPPKLEEKIQFGSICDYSHEREWRVPHDLPFEYSDVKFVVLNSFNDLKSVPQDLVKAIGSEKFILMENYRHVEKLWPVHIMH